MKGKLVPEEVDPSISRDFDMFWSRGINEEKLQLKKLLLLRPFLQGNQTLNRVNELATCMVPGISVFKRLHSACSTLLQFN